MHWCRIFAALNMIKILHASPNTTPSQVRLAVAAFFFVSGFGFASWASRIPTLQQKLHLNEAELGSTLFAMPLGLMLTLPLTSYLLNKYSSRYVMLMGSVFYNILLCILGFVTNTFQFVTVLFLFGCSRNLMNIPVNAQSVGVQTLYPKSILSTFHGIWSVSGFAAAALGAWMISSDITPSIHFIIIGAICLTTMAIFFKNTFPNDVKKTNAVGKKKLFNFPDKPLVKLGLIAFSCMACEGIMYDWSGIYFQKVVHPPKALFAIGYVAFMSAASTGRFVGDWFINKLGVKKVLQICSSLIAVGLLLSVLLPYLFTATAGFVLTGLGISCIMPMLMGLAGKLSDKAPGVAIASVSTVSYFGFLLGPPIIGYVAEAANLRWSFSIGIVMACVMFGLVSKMKLVK